jgi:hypothetical protein
MTAPNEATGVWPLSSAMAPLGVLRTGPGCARANVRFTLAAWNFGHFAETAELVVSEMVTNAVEASTVHGSPLYVGGRMLVVWVRLFSDGFRLIIEVVDQAPGVPVERKAAPDDECGRGLPLVGACTVGRWVGCRARQGSAELRAEDSGSGAGDLV